VSHAYVAVQWNRQKRLYDASLAAGLALYLTLFVGLGALANPGATAETLVIRGLGTAALLLLHVILCIGPLCRLSPALLPLLYNRRHLGVTMFALALAHAGFAAFQFHALGDVNPLVSVLTANTRFASVSQFPFEAFGLVALAILFVMAATSHDFWLAFLGPKVWKALHMALYVAYGLVVLHVSLGIMQDDRSVLIPAMLVSGFGLVATLHLIAGWRERSADRGAAASNGWIAVGPLHSIPDKGARIVSAPGGERIAVFRDGDQIGALTNLCAHQNGPLGEGRIIDGCVTCPWHGYQYRLADGRAPAPFTEKLVTYKVRLGENGLLEVDPRPLPPGTPAAITCMLTRG
jgi:sulfoxide reductase heme-binding subunit YedZ